MKKLFALVILIIVFALPSPASCGTCCQGVTWIRGGDCNNYWHKFSVPSYCRIAKSSGDGTWSWGDKTRVQLPKVTIYFDPSGYCQSWGTGNHTVIKPTDCSVGSGSSSTVSRSPSKPVSPMDSYVWTEMQLMGINILIRIIHDPAIPDNIGEVWAAQYPVGVISCPKNAPPLGSPLTGVTPKPTDQAKKLTLSC